MTDFVLTRVQCDPDVTIGELSIGNHRICYVLEDPVRETDQPVEAWKIKGETAIPRGRYRVQRTFSNRFGHTTPQLLSVPGFEGIRIHPGNSTADTEGCLLPGLERREKTVGQSQLAYREILKWLDTIEQNGEEAWMTIQFEPQVPA